MKTLKDAIEAKQKLEQDILALVREFEVEYDIWLSDICMNKNDTMGCKDGVTTGIKIKVKI